jgi:hypothetical protein
MSPRPPYPIQPFPKVKDYVAYAGIGSKETPDNICHLMRGIARLLYDRGYVLRSGGAPGADEAFEQGTPVMATMEIFLPWNRFNGKPDLLHLTPTELGVARSIAEKYHPNWLACSEGAKKLHTRNTMQILGRDCATPSKFVVCWTSNGKAIGGTGQALRIAEDKKIKIYNLHDPGTRILFYQELGWEHDL